MSEQSKPAEKCFAEHMHIHESGWTNCACDRDAGHDDDYHEDSSVQVRWPVKAPVKGYVVRGTNPSGTVGYAVGRDGTLPIAVANYQGAKTVYALLDVADSAAVDLRREGCTGVRVYRVHADGSEMPMPTYAELAAKARNPAMGTETPLPSYEEAVAEIERLRARVADLQDGRDAAVAEALARLRAERERDEARAELAHLKAHADTMPIAFAPVPLGNRRPAVTGGECSACLVAPPYHEAMCERRGAVHDLTPSEVACAKVLDAIEAYEETPGAYRSREYNTPESIRDAALDTIALDALFKTGLKRSGYITDEGRDLLARARKAGILGVSAAERAAWARYVDATIDDRDATFAEEQEQNGAEEWCKRTKAALAAAKQALRDLGVDVDALLKSTEGT